jgi:hypothetical protein
MAQVRAPTISLIASNELRQIPHRARQWWAALVVPSVTVITVLGLSIRL